MARAKQKSRVVVPEKDRRIWSAPEREAWRLPADVTVSEWADKYRRLLPRTSAEPGPWRTARTPYLREPMNCFTDPLIEEITIMSSTQVGKTEVELNILGYIIDEDPSPVLYVVPLEPNARSFSRNRVLPMLEQCPQLARHLSGRTRDTNAFEYYLDNMTLAFAWARSPAQLAQRPIRVVLLDEIDKYPKDLKEEADPLYLAKERTTTFWNRKVVKVGTPTTKDGRIYREYEASDQRRYHIFCPHCSAGQPLEFRNLRWPKKKDAAGDEHSIDAETIKRDGLAWYECEECGARIEERDRDRLVAAGKWVRTVEAESSHAGFWINALYSPWRTWSEIAAEWLKAQGRPEVLHNFINSWLAEPWEEVGDAPPTTALEHCIDGRAGGTVPPDCLALTAGVDIQADRCYYVIRAWGYHLRSWLVDEGVVSRSEKSLGALDVPLLADYSGWPIALTFIDSGYDTDLVYSYCRARAPTVVPSKGQPRWKLPVTESLIEVVNRKRIPGGLKLCHLDTDFWKSWIHNRIRLDPDDVGAWSIHSQIAEDYIAQILNERKVQGVRRGRKFEEWQVTNRRLGSHFLDCEVGAAAAAWHLGIQRLDPEANGQAAPRPKKRRKKWSRGGRGGSWRR